MIQSKLFFLGFLLLMQISVFGQADIEKALFELPNVIFKKIDTPKGFESAYELKIKQPIDHLDESKGYFYQRVYLSHVNYNAPTVIITNGYGKASNTVTEVARLLGANQINVEHRFFLESSPEEKDYQYLTFEQVSADLHHINKLFRAIYKGKWLASGISKGGTTCIFYRYFYPDDVDVSIPYVAPINLSVEDERLYRFLDTIGSDDCREDILNFQKLMLIKAEEYKPYLKWFAKGRSLEFNYLSFDEAYEYAVLEYPFSFWQYGNDCSAIPEDSAGRDAHLQYLMDLVGLEFFSDVSMESYASHYYQSGTQMGYYGYETDDFKGLLNHLSYKPNPSAVFLPNKMEADFDGGLTKKVYNWTHTADHMIYINGALDTWSATAAPKSDQNNSLYYFLDGKHHATARIREMNSEQRNKLIQTLEAWLEMSIEDIYR